MLKISFLHRNTHTETVAPLITCVFDDTVLKTIYQTIQLALVVFVIYLF